jgi:hypothetical protein
VLRGSHGSGSLRARTLNPQPDDRSGHVSDGPVGCDAPVMGARRLVASRPRRRLGSGPRCARPSRLASRPRFRGRHARRWPGSPKSEQDPVDQTRNASSAGTAGQSPTELPQILG